ncbi:interleukin-9 receptor-like isoform X2 [Ahaetulla prasina]|uniref:interleukin-9 receptor-like isoform X2 n=1 Tax=Ahaetulla prasina TaxID=499056 RepID=UPI00264928C6|nr:interleukin-9 receptor-like isoform X2 [Ahaetulla prasina]
MGKASCGTAACLTLWARFFLLSAMEQTAEAASRVQCLNNYGFQGRRLDCRWHRNQALEGTLFYLNFSDTLGLSSDLICPLSASPGTPDHFNCSVHSKEGEFTENDEYKVVLHVSSLGENQTNVIFLKYKPRLHIQCDPPFDLQSKCSDNTCCVRWKRPKACEEILEDWQWELAFKAVQEPWEQAQRRVFVNSETWVHIESFEFKSDRDYVARMRCKTPEENHHYGSHWSPWSSCVTWTAHPGDWQQLDAPIYLLFCLGTLLLLLALAFALFKRVQRSCGASIPTPATFFQPLYLAHQGVFKGWAGLAPEEAAEAVSRLSFLQLPTCTMSGPAKQCASPLIEELRGAALEAEHPPSDYCTLGGAAKGVAPIPAHWPQPLLPPSAHSGPPAGSLPLCGKGRAQEPPGTPAALGGLLQDSGRSGEVWPMQPLFL